MGMCANDRGFVYSGKHGTDFGVSRVGKDWLKWTTGRSVNDADHWRVTVTERKRIGPCRDLIQALIAKLLARPGWNGIVRPLRRCTGTTLFQNVDFMIAAYHGSTDLMQAIHNLWRECAPVYDITRHDNRIDLKLGQIRKHGLKRR